MSLPRETIETLQEQLQQQQRQNKNLSAAGLLGSLEEFLTNKYREI